VSSSSDFSLLGYARMLLAICMLTAFKIIWINFGDLMDFLYQFMSYDWFSHCHGFYYSIKISWLIIHIYC